MSPCKELKVDKAENFEAGAECYEERAAIGEFEAGMTRKDAEPKADYLHRDTSESF
jgi:hypothetical protein